MSEPLELHWVHKLEENKCSFEYLQYHETEKDEI